MNNDAQLLIARLLTLRALPRSDGAVRRLLVDEAFREAVVSQLAYCGLTLLDNPYAAHVAVGLNESLQNRILTEETWAAKAQPLDRHSAATLVVLWALLILPKRERQARRSRAKLPDKDLFGVQTQIIAAPEEVESVGSDAFVADYKNLLGAETTIRKSLGVLARLDFIEQRNKRLYEGPLLDLAVDYAKLAPRILDGALQQALAAQAVSPDGEAPAPGQGGA